MPRPSRVAVTRVRIGASLNRINRQFITVIVHGMELSPTPIKMINQPPDHEYIHHLLIRNHLTINRCVPLSISMTNWWGMTLSQCFFSGLGTLSTWTVNSWTIWVILTLWQKILALTSSFHLAYFYEIGLECGSVLFLPRSVLPDTYHALDITHINSLNLCHVFLFDYYFSFHAQSRYDVVWKWTFKNEDTDPLTRAIERYVVAGALGTVDIRVDAAARLVDTDLHRLRKKKEIK